MFENLEKLAKAVEDARSARFDAYAQDFDNGDRFINPPAVRKAAKAALEGAIEELRNELDGVIAGGLTPDQAKYVTRFVISF